MIYEQTAVYAGAGMCSHLKRRYVGIPTDDTAIIW